MGMPEGYLSTTTLKGKKEENISMNPRYSRMLSGIQQSLSRGIGDFIYKHLQYKYSKKDAKGNIFIEREIDRNCIEVKFQSITNIDNRLDMEQMMLTAETMGNVAGVLDVIAGSPNLPIKTNGESFMRLWESMTESVPALRESLEIDYALDEQNDLTVNGMVDSEDDLESPEDMQGIEDNPTLSAAMSKEKEKINKNTKSKTEEKDIKDIFH
jgi:hypothetical protein